MIQVGQKLLVYKTDRRYRDNPPREVTVEKIGRKYATIDHGRRVNLETMFIDCGHFTPDERCYLSAEDRQNELDLEAAWHRLSDAVRRRHRSPTSNIDSIRQAAVLLNLPEAE